jgi:hypothetical protein
MNGVMNINAIKKQAINFMLNKNLKFFITSMYMPAKSASTVSTYKSNPVKDKVTAAAKYHINLLYFTALINKIKNSKEKKIDVDVG